MEWAPDIQESGAYFCACGDNTAETGAGQGIDLLDCEGVAAAGYLEQYHVNVSVVKEKRCKNGWFHIWECL